MNVEIRQELKEEYFETEKMVRESFWNKYRPGCNEHYMVHLMRSHQSWLPEFSRIALVDGKIAGLIMYFSSKIKQADGKEINVASFGPLCVSHKYRNLGVGKKLLEETLPLVKQAGYPGVLIVGEPDYYPKVGFIRSRERGITDAEGNSWDPYMVYEFEKNGMNFPGVFEEPYEITDAIPPVPPAEYESKFEAWTAAAIPCQFEFPNPGDDEKGYHLRRADEKPFAFDDFFEKTKSGSGRKIRENPLLAGFIIEKGRQEIGMCVISCEGQKPEAKCLYLKEDFCNQGIQEDILATLKNAN